MASTTTPPGVKMLEGKHWYAGSISERQTERILGRISQPGVFLVRSSLLPDVDYVLSVYNKSQEVWHYDISIQSSEECVLNSYVFPNIVEAISFYTENRIGGVFLEEPEEPVVTLKELYASKTSTVVRKAPLSMKSSEPRVSGQYASSDDGLSTDSGLVESSHSNTAMDWNVHSGEPIASEMPSAPPDTQYKPQVNNPSHMQEPQSSKNDIHRIDNAAVSEIQDEVDSMTEEEDRRYRTVSLIRKRSRADQLKELRRLPSINEKRAIIQRKIKGDDIDDEQESDSDGIEDAGKLLPSTSDKEINVSATLRKKPLSQTLPTGPPPIPERHTKPKAAEMNSIQIHALTESNSVPGIPVANKPAKELNTYDNLQNVGTEDKPGHKKGTTVSGALVNHFELTPEPNIEKKPASDGDEDRPPSPPLSTHPEIIAARISRDFIVENMAAVSVKDSSTPNSVESNNQGSNDSILEHSHSPAPVEILSTSSSSDYKEENNSILTAGNSSNDSMQVEKVILTVEDSSTPNLTKQDENPVTITIEGSATFNSNDSNIQDKELVVPRSPVPKPRSPRPRNKFPKPRPRNMRSSLVLEDDIADQVLHRPLSKQFSLPDVKRPQLTLPPPPSDPPPPQEKEVKAPQVSPSPKEAQKGSSSSPSDHSLKENLEVVADSTPPPTKDKTPSPSMLRHFYFSNPKVVTIPGLEVSGTAETASRELSTGQTLGGSESPPLEVSSPTHVQTVVSCGPMNSRRGPPLKKKRSIFRKKN